jgi:hypothetical protein
MSSAIMLQKMCSNSGNIYGVEGEDVTAVFYTAAYGKVSHPRAPNYITDSDFNLCQFLQSMH